MLAGDTAPDERARSLTGKPWSPRLLPENWAPADGEDEWTPPPADPRLAGDINRGYAQPATVRPTLAELRSLLARLWRRYRERRGAA